MVPAKSRVTPSVRVRAWFREVLLCLICLVVYECIHTPLIVTQWMYLHVHCTLHEKHQHVSNQFMPAIVQGYSQAKLIFVTTLETFRLLEGSILYMHIPSFTQQLNFHSYHHSYHPE